MLKFAGALGLLLPLVASGAAAGEKVLYSDIVAKRLAAQNAKFFDSSESSGQARIVGGTIASSSLHKFQVGLYQDIGGGMYSFFCGGTLYKQKYVITAAHCSDFVTAGEVLVNAKSRQADTLGEASLVSAIHIHPGWSPSTFNSDVAVWDLITPITGLSSPPLAGSDPSTGTKLKVTGWGATSEGGAGSVDLREVTVPLFSRSKCDQNYGGAITKRMFCAGYKAGGKDSCQGDSGGPITRKRSDGKRVLLGIVSWGNGCARPNFPGIYTRISNDSIRNFIKNNTP